MDLSTGAVRPVLRGAAGGPRKWIPPGAFDDYRLVKLLGCGTMGDVYLAHDRVLDRLIAIKFAGHLDPWARDRFLVEARAVARIQQANVMAIFHVGELDGHPYFVSEYVPGRSLAELTLPIPWLHALELAVGLARGLAAAHRQGVLHRDIKPANVLLDERGGVKLLDFGLAKLLAESTPDDRGHDELLAADLETTAPGTLLGTPKYMAPELWRAEPASRSSDVYALGVLVYILCLGRPPRDAATSFELGELVQTQEPPPLAERVADIDPRFAAILDRCIRRAPHERYASGEELRAALEALVPLVHAAAAHRANPYRGLRPYAAEHAADFHGRAAEIQAVVAHLRTRSLVVVSGDPGVGKTSLCRAGVLPAIRGGALGPGRTWTAAEVAPGPSPSHAIVAALARCLHRPSTPMTAALDQDPEKFLSDVRRDLGDARGALLLIDPLEQLTTLAGPLAAAAAARLLVRLLADVPGIRVLATAQDGLLPRLSPLPGLHAVPSAVHLLTRSPRGVHAAVVGPARARGVRFESEALVEHLVAVGVEGGLALLQLTLAELWEARDVGDATITAAALERIGGVSAVLARHADRALSRMPADQRRAARILLLRLVTAEETRASLSAEDLLVGGGSRATLDALLAARLVVLRPIADVVVHEIAHVALIRGWLTLQAWLDGDREARAVRHRIESDAAAWHRLARADAALWSASQLAAGPVDPVGLRPRELAFLAASRAHVRRHRVMRRLATLTTAVVLFLAPLALFTHCQPRLPELADIPGLPGRRGDAVNPALGATDACREP